MFLMDRLDMRLKLLLNNFELKEDIGELGRFLFKRHKYMRATFYAFLWLILSCGKVLFG